MKHFSKFITKHYKGVLVVAIAALLLSVYGLSLTKINYNILSYIPNNLNSAKGETILDKDFHTAGSALMLVDLKDLQKVQDLKDKIEKVEGVKSVLWIDSLTDTTVPLNYISDSFKEQFIKGNSTMLQIQFEDTASSVSTANAVSNIRKLMDSQSKLGGMGAILTDLKTLVSSEKIIYVLLAVALIFILLSIALDSYAVSILLLISIGLAIAFNMGTNFLQGSISYITSAIAAVLQLGVTMDFSIFLYHRYEQERKKYDNKFDAMAKAMSATSVAIIASSLATASGFLALIVMKIGIGADIGIVLAKGVIFGVITCLTVLPALLLFFDNFIQRTKHRPVLPTFKGTANFVTKNYVIIFVIFLILFIPAYIGKTNVSIAYNIMDAMPSSMQSMKDTNSIKKTFNISEVIYLITDKSESRAKEESLQSDIDSMTNVKNTTSIESLADSKIPDSFVPEKLKDQFQAGKYRYTMINLSTEAASVATNKTLEKIKSRAAHYYGSKYYLTGEAVLTEDMINLVANDEKTVDIISIAAVFLILMIAMKSFSLPIILVSVIELAIFFNLGIPYYTGSSISFIATMTIGAIQLGSSINYSILMVTRYREELRRHEKVQAIKNAIMGTGPSILTSALTLAITTIAVGVVSKIKMIGSFATMIGRGTLISLVMVMLILPALLLIFDKVIKYTTIGWKGLGKRKNEDVKGEEIV